MIIYNMSGLKKKSIKNIISIFFFLLIIIMVIVAIFSWLDLKVAVYEIHNEKIDNGFRIVHLSDLHSVFWGENQVELIEKIDGIKPDIICLTGDIADDHISHDGTKALIQEIGKKYRCFYVTGNHETYVPEGLDIIKKEIFEDNGVKVLDPGWEEIEINGQKVNICGIDDIEILRYDKWMDNLIECSQNKTEGLFSILLTHRPERYKEYSEQDFDLILSGHTHGGQIRIPRICNGIYASNQGIFPKYVGGEYKLENGSIMIVSRGLVKNLIPRTFNPPEIEVIDILGK